MAILRAVFSLALAAVVSTAVPARAVDIVPGPEGGPPITDLRLVNNKYELRDVATGQLIMQQRGALPLVVVNDARVTYTVQMNEQPTGYDMVVTFTNPTALTLPVGQIYIGMLTLGADIEWLDVRHTSVWRAANFSTFVGKSFIYPDDFYSPVYVIRNQQYAIGVSLRYPALEYDHAVRVGFMNPKGSNSGEGGPGWGGGFQISDTNGTPPSMAMKHPGTIAPHTSKTYVASVRVATDDPDKWMRTLLPYRSYFRQLYGGVRYERATQPMLPVGIASEFYQGAGNLDGFGDPNLRRPDVFGWGPWTDYLLSAFPAYHNLTLWAGTGLYFFNPQHNYPFQITSRWAENPIMADAFDPEVGLPRLGAAGRSLGIWWGRSLEVAETWDPAVTTPLDPANPVHVQLAEKELDGAVLAGASVVGLDTFNTSQTGPRKAYNWLTHIVEKYPSIRFVAEPSPCDILNTLVGGVIPGWAFDGQIKTLEDCYPFRTSHSLADFLLPGNELIMGFRYNIHKDLFGFVPTPEEVDHDVRWFASLGFVPMVWTPVPTVGDVRAAESWRWTVPPELQLEIDSSGGDSDNSSGDDATGGGSADQGAGTTGSGGTPGDPK